MLLSEMNRSHDTAADIVTYSVLLKALAERGDVPAAMRLFKDMVARSVQPDEVVFNSILLGCSVTPSSGGTHLGPEAIMDIFNTLLLYGLQPSSATLSIVLKAFAKTEAWDESLELMSEAPKQFRLKPEQRLYGQLALSCLRAQQGEKAVETYKAMLKAADLRREPPDEEITNRLLRFCISGNGDYSIASDIYQAAIQAGTRPDPKICRQILTSVFG
eukprot:gnl/TRDRNA2_/TRDRNA2_160939_c2_seq2.p1 gnl/TRDRNA2_/TRDRNA2_160939_c2~~gnl/TRDRNA2_/TRDRNA2_160939_c2_seq2.p1  ORF type:complete len:243 (+),score=53.17 gnl/TRDRNA2_/TRDRNA2_160939_c2_seq2:80-730(+)